MLVPDEAGEDEDENEVTSILGDEYEDVASPRQYLKSLGTWPPPRAKRETKDL